MKQTFILFLVFFSMQVVAQENTNTIPADGIYTFYSKSTQDTLDIEKVKVVIKDSKVIVYNIPEVTDSVQTEQKELHNGYLWLNSSDNKWYVVPHKQKIKAAKSLDLCSLNIQVLDIQKLNLWVCR